MTELQSGAKRAKTIRDLFNDKSVQAAIVAALPKHLDPIRMLRVYQTAAQVTPRIADCDALSVVGAVVQAAQLGLSLDTIMGESYLIPRKNKFTQSTVCQFQIGYKGYIKLARNADEKLRDIFAHTVYDGDIFEFELGMEPRILVHKYDVKARTRGQLVAAYTIGVWADGYKHVELVNTSDVERAKARSESFMADEKYNKQMSPWSTDPDPMWRKTAVRRWCTRVPLSAGAELGSALLSETIDGRTFYSAGMELSAASVAASQSNEPAPAAPGAPPELNPPNPLDTAASWVEKDRERENAPVAPIPPKAAAPAAAPTAPPPAQPATPPAGRAPKKAPPRRPTTAAAPTAPAAPPQQPTLPHTDTPQEPAATRSASAAYDDEAEAEFRALVANQGNPAPPPKDSAVVTPIVDDKDDTDDGSDGVA